MKLTYSSTSTNSEQNFYLTIFEHTELQPTAYMDLANLDLAFKYGIESKLQVYDWSDGEDEDNKPRGMNSREISYSLDTLVKECE